MAIRRSVPVRDGRNDAEGEGGIALLTVLWGTALLTIVVLGLAGLVKAQLSTVRHAVDAAQARALAEAGIQRALAEMVAVPQTERWRFDGTPHDLQWTEGAIRIEIQDVFGLIDLSTAREELIDGILRAVGVERELQPALRDAILDWRDADNLRRLYGAEDDAYHAAGLGYAAKDGAFDVVEELRQVMGMDADTYRRLEPMVTIASGRAGVNPEWAPEPVLRALPGITADAVAAYVEARAALAPGARATPLAGVDQQFLDAGGGDSFRITSEAVTVEGTRARVVATVRSGGQADRPYTILSWRQ